MGRPHTRAHIQDSPQLVEQSSRLAPAGTTPLNFKVPSEFRREFKTYAAQHNKKLNQLLYEAFAALKAQND
jgi:hypothetical protein